MPHVHLDASALRGFAPLALRPRRSFTRSLPEHVLIAMAEHRAGLASLWDDLLTEYQDETADMIGGEV